MKCSNCGSPEFIPSPANGQHTRCAHCGAIWPTKQILTASWLRVALIGKTTNRPPKPAPTSVPSSGKKTSV